MPKGFLKINVSSAKGRILINDALVRIYLDNRLIVEKRSDLFGNVEEISLEAFNNKKRYRLEVSSPNFETQELENIFIFANDKSYINVYLVGNVEKEDNFETDLVSVEDDDNYPNVSTNTQYVYNEVVIPREITVHLGPPASNARNVTVDFVYYIKNVACSEIYPSWPKEAIRANVLAIVSLSLNRIYTAWYKVKGYDFQITSSTQYDQKFIENRNIFDTISEVVDDTFNEYIRYLGNLEPLFASYCDGRQVQCDGMSQWGSYELANKGYNALEILRNYYGKNIELTTCNQIEDIHDIYPGTILKLGDANNDVYIMQTMLNRIAIDYPNILKIYPANGIFTLRMQESVKQFQRQFNLDADGIIGKATWYKICYIYLSVKKLAQLESEGEKLPVTALEYPGILRVGSSGLSVEYLQFYLNVIAQFYSGINEMIMDGRFGNATYNSVRAFQRLFGLNTDGIVGSNTWNKITEVFLSVYEIIPKVDETIPYPGIVLKQGSNSDYVVYLQTYLNAIADYYSEINHIDVDGYFGNDTKNAVEAFQKTFDLQIDGIVGRATWDKIIDIYNDIIGIVLYPKREFKYGDRDNYVRILQLYLNSISEYYPSIPPLAVDGIFGEEMEKAVKQFQEIFGLLTDGIVGRQTWNKIIEVYLNDVREANVDQNVDTIYDYLNDNEYHQRKYYNETRTGK